MRTLRFRSEPLFLRVQEVGCVTGSMMPSASKLSGSDFSLLSRSNGTRPVNSGRYIVFSQEDFVRFVGDRFVARGEYIVLFIQNILAGDLKCGLVMLTHLYWFG